jgi:predicted transcriptional regulator
MNEVKIKVESKEAFFASAMKMAAKLDKGDFSTGNAIKSFETMEQFLRIMTSNRWSLLRTLRQSGPSSIRALSQLLARDYRGVHADVASLLEAGLIEKQADAKIRVPWTKIVAEMDVELAA